MQAIEVITESPAQTLALGESIGRGLSGGELMLLDGPLGAGKTTFVQGVARGLDIQGPVQSPSFVLERIHWGRLELRHLDYYRLTGDEIGDSGLLPDSGDSMAVTAVEWAKRAGPLPEADLLVEIMFLPGAPDKRRILLRAAGEFMKEKIAHAVEAARSENRRSGH